MPTPASNQPAGAQPQMSKEDLRLQYNEMFMEWDEATRAGESVKADILKRKLMQMAQRTFGG